MENLVENVLKASKKESIPSFKTIEVNSLTEIIVDEGNLLAEDHNDLEGSDLRASQESYLRSLARQNVQALINRIWELPTERDGDVIVAELPEPKALLPRERHVPEDKALTKWEKYAQLKGVKKRKKSRMVWDDQEEQFKARWGYNRANDPRRQWLIEVPQNADPFEDQFEKLNKERKERIAKNELKRLRNLSRVK